MSTEIKEEKVEETTETGTQPEEKKPAEVEKDEYEEELKEIEKEKPSPEVSPEEEKRQKELRQALFTRKKLEERIKTLGGSVEEEEEVEVEDIDVKDLVKKEVAEASKTFVKDFIDEKIKSMSDNPSLQKLVRYHYENSIKQTGLSREQIANDLSNALILANRKKIEKRIGEVVKGKESNDTKGGGSTTGQKPGETDLPKLSPMEEKILSRQGLTAKDVVNDAVTGL